MATHTAKKTAGAGKTGTASAHPQQQQQQQQPQYEGSFPYGVPASTTKKPPIGATVAKSDRTLSSQKLNPHKFANPFQNNLKQCRTLFSQSYVSGAIPCRLQTSAVKMSLQWDEHAKSGFSPDLLAVCADGLCEKDHPYAVMAPMMFHELLYRADGCVEMVQPVAEPVFTSIRKALMLEHSVAAAIRALQVLVEQTGAMIMPYLGKVVPCLQKHIRDKKYRDSVLLLLGTIEQAGGPEATKIIKSKIPTY